ncbi:hypothetical protein LSM04_005901 [Trypanosoma melophagium]|uniref:uncharacterized protein n=1 Tax=Trypanosoma melophagium TaxID=715481 RepID=UPI00351A2FCB|nr:hypothetical protein LSM04_005901 [Trypanosoma melophagium]
MADLCAISFVPQFKGYYVVVVRSMSSRRIKVHVDFTQCSRYSSSEGLESPRVVLYTDEIADGEAYLISAVNKSKTPYSLLYQISCDATFPNDSTVGTSTVINSGKESNVKEMKSSTFYFVPTDGWECEPIIALKGFLPGNGDVALVWVVRRDVSTGNSNPSFLYRFTVMPCEPDIGQLHSHQTTRKTKDDNVNADNDGTAAREMFKSPERDNRRGKHVFKCSAGI